LARLSLVKPQPDLKVKLEHVYIMLVALRTHTSLFRIVVVSYMYL